MDAVKKGGRRVPRAGGLRGVFGGLTRGPVAEKAAFKRRLGAEVGSETCGSWGGKPVQGRGGYLRGVIGGSKNRNLFF